MEKGLNFIHKTNITTLHSHETIDIFLLVLGLLSEYLLYSFIFCYLLFRLYVVFGVSGYLLLSIFSLSMFFHIKFFTKSDLVRLSPTFSNDTIFNKCICSTFRIQVTYAPTVGFLRLRKRTLSCTTFAIYRKGQW